MIKNGKDGFTDTSMCKAYIPVSEVELAAASEGERLVPVHDGAAATRLPRGEGQLTGGELEACAERNLLLAESGHWRASSSPLIPSSSSSSSSSSSGTARAHSTVRGVGAGGAGTLRRGPDTHME